MHAPLVANRGFARGSIAFVNSNLYVSGAFVDAPRSTWIKYRTARGESTAEPLVCISRCHRSKSDYRYPGYLDDHHLGKICMLKEHFEVL